MTDFPEMAAAQQLVILADAYAPGRWRVVVEATQLCARAGLPPPAWLVRAVEQMASAAPGMAGRRGQTPNLAEKLTRYRVIQLYMDKGHKELRNGEWRPTKTAIHDAIKHIEGKHNQKRYQAYLDSYNDVANDDDLTYLGVVPTTPGNNSAE